MYKPDYGLKLFQDGVRSDTNLYFPDFPLYSITIISEGQYTTMVDMPVDGKLYALSLDFDQEQLNEILEQASSISRNMIQHELSKNPHTSRTIDFSSDIKFNVVAQLGELQTNQDESYIPLVLGEISSNILSQMDLEEQVDNTNVEKEIAIEKLESINDNTAKITTLKKGYFLDSIVSKLKSCFIFIGLGILSFIGSIIYHEILPFFISWVTLGANSANTYISAIAPAPVVIFFALWSYSAGIYFFNQKLIKLSQLIIILSIAMGIIILIT